MGAMRVKGTAGMIIVAMMAGLTGCSTVEEEGTTRSAVPVDVVADFVAPVTPKIVKILGCCDSITTGNDGTSYRDELTALLPAGIEPVYVTTAMPGSPCSMWAPMLGALIKANKPDVLLLNCGTNDVVLSNAQLKAFERTYLSMIEQARAAGVKVTVSKLMISDVSTRPSQAWLPGNEAKINRVIDRVARIYGDVGLADFSLIPADSATTTDGVHPSPFGEQKYANAWFVEGSRLGWW